jgi:Glycosyl hydrolase 2 galactose-binding domain-like/Exo-beta-D-glucosaminidase Ig-fold domain/Glycosyl hydrolases family 2/NedA-like, galactose-binding domain
MSNSRRTFLKTTIAGASMAFQDLRGLAIAPGGATSVAARAPSAVDKREAGMESSASPYTRGVGVYPGDPRQDFAPTLAPDGTTYRNLARLRPAYHSSSYDYNLTAQLVTDGIKHTHFPTWVGTSASFQGPLDKREREFILDHNPTSTSELRGPRPWVQVELGGGEGVPEIDRVDLLVVAPAGAKAENLTFTVSVSEDGREWRQAGSVTGPPPASLTGYPPRFARPGQLFTPSIALNQPSQSRFYQVECADAAATGFAFGTVWLIGQVAFFNKHQRVQLGGPYSFTSAWMSAGLDEEWVYVDLGARLEFDRVVLYWIARAAEGSLQVSDDAENWRDIQPLSAGAGLTDDMKLAAPVQGRYVRVLMTRPSSQHGYILSEIEVYGRGGFVAQPKAAPPARGDGRLDLAGGAWRLQRDSLVQADGEALSKPGFNDHDWVVATVPGTVLSSYLNIGAIPDPNYGENQLLISDSFFYADFWYRNEFTAPTLDREERAWLNLDGINWKADVFLNGAELGRIEGGFMRGRFDVTDRLLPGQRNSLAVRVERNATPGSIKQKTFESPGKNGGALGADNPTFHASIGWDWIPTIRGRNTGIWDDVYLTVSGPVTIENPFVTTALPDSSRADVTIQLDLVNQEAKPVKGILRGRFGDVRFEERVRLEASATQTVKLDPGAHPELRLQNPKLWWPAGYGAPYLYDVELAFEGPSGKVTDSRAFKAGVRQMTYSEEGGALKIWINGRRFIARGGNWGFSESLLRYRGREFDAAARYHREMNFTMIRNWVGQTGGDEFYEACDRNGIMVWQDFWLANPFDGPDPDNDDLFMRNVRDLVLRIRNHASIGLYCGRNEGFPPPPLESGIRKVLAELHPGIHYIPSSADNVVSGHGPYRAMPRSFYFGFGADPKLHSEMGMPNIPVLESVRAMMPKTAQWPQGLAWGLHDFCLEGAQGGRSFRTTIEESYGGASSFEEWVSLAQFVNYDGYRAMFEAQSKHRMGLLLWMSHPCWPSFVWQTYDYYLEPSAAYFGCKKACEPLHIQWNPVTESIEVVNYNGGNVSGLTARAEILNMDGSRQWDKSVTLDSSEDSVSSCIKIEYPSGLTPLHFLRLSLSTSGNSAAKDQMQQPAGKGIISENFYLRGLEEENFRAIRTLPKVNVQATTTQSGLEKGVWRMATSLKNVSQQPALMVRVKAVREKSRDRILPAIYSDNYIALMPGEERVIHTELWDADTRGEEPQIVVEGFNAGQRTES